MQQTLISARQYAKHRGVSHTAVQKALRDGRIPASNGKIDPVAADAAWKANTDPSKQTGSIAEPAAGSAKGSYATSRAVRESYLARLAKLEYEEKAGRLVSADEVRITTFNLARSARNMLLALPDRLAPILAAMTSAREVHALLMTELRRVCEEISGEHKR
jgi:hypothetical protein